MTENKPNLPSSRLSEVGAVRTDAAIILALLVGIATGVGLSQSEASAQDGIDPSETSTLTTTPIVDAGEGENPFPGEAFHGEFPFTTALAGIAANLDEITQSLTTSLVEQFEARKLEIEQLFNNGGNALLTSLARPFEQASRDDVFVNDPDAEYGLGHEVEDIAAYRMSDEIAEDFATMSASEIFNKSDSGLFTSGIVSWGHDRDFSTMVMAIGLAFHEDESLFVTKNSGTEYSLEQILDIMNNNPSGELASNVLAIQNEILEQIQEREFGTSQAENERRLAGGDNSSLLDRFAGPDQWESCDVELIPNTVARPDQQQNLRRVAHVNQGADTRSSADSGKEAILFVATIEFVGDTMVFDLDAFTGRAYEEGYENSPVWQEMLPCGVDKVFVPNITATAPARTPVKTPEKTPTPPENTPTPTQRITLTPTLPNTATPTVEDTPTPVSTNPDTGDDLTLTPAITPQRTATDIP